MRRSKGHKSQACHCVCVCCNLSRCQAALHFHMFGYGNGPRIAQYPRPPKGLHLCSLLDICLLTPDTTVTFLRGQTPMCFDNWILLQAETCPSPPSSPSLHMLQKYRVRIRFVHVTWVQHGSRSELSCMHGTVKEVQGRDRL